MGTPAPSTSTPPPPERDRLVRVHGLDLDARTSDGACPALTRTLGATGSCTVHPHRPMICRLWGVAASMPCPHGCIPTGGYLTDTDTLRRLLASLETGGHPQTGTRRLLEQCMADPHAATLMAAMLRGDPTATPALHAHLTTRQLPTTTEQSHAVARGATPARRSKSPNATSEGPHSGP